MIIVSNKPWILCQQLIFSETPVIVVITICESKWAVIDSISIVLLTYSEIIIIIIVLFKPIISSCINVLCAWITT